MREYDSKLRAYIATWDSFADLAADCCPRGHLLPNDCLDRPGFVGRTWESWDAVSRDCQTAWTAGADTVTELRDALDLADLPRPVSRRRTLRWREDDGDELDRDRLYAGAAPWRATVRECRSGPQFVQIVTDVCTPCNIDHDDILWRGAAAVALTDILESAGYRVELIAAQYVTHAYDDNRRGLAAAVTLKRPGDPLDIATLAAAVSGWAYRSVWFAAYPYCQPNDINGGLGTVQPLAEALPALVGPPAANCQRIVCQKIFSAPAAITWLRNSLAAFAEPAAA